MKYIKFNLKDGIPVKFKVTNDTYGLRIKWKYIGQFNFCKYIVYSTSKWAIANKVTYLERITDEELINECSRYIEEDHNDLKNIKRII